MKINKKIKQNKKNQMIALKVDAQPLVKKNGLWWDAKMEL